MIRTQIILGLQNGTPVFLPQEGLAVSTKIAYWLFSYCGWKNQKSGYPILHFLPEEPSIQQEEIEREEGYLYFDNKFEWWVLGGCINLN